MSTADIRVDDEMYNIIMTWVAEQGFSQRSRRFVANINLSSRFWLLWTDSDKDSDEDQIELEESPQRSQPRRKSKKPVQYTPSFGTHYFWHKGRLFIFQRTQDSRQSYSPVSEREEISLSCFGRNPIALKELLDECRDRFIKNDENKTLIYRGGLKPGGAEPTWTRCMSRVSRPFSTVVLDEEVKKELVDDMTDYLHPATRRWYSNRGIPYRRGYLLYGPPGTGKSSLSFAIAGFFNLKIYIISLNSPAMNEENLGTLFAELPNACVVLLEDIDTAGLTHTRDNMSEVADNAPKQATKIPVDAAYGLPTVNSTGGRISLSALLNILDGVASQEGRILIMTTNHIDKLDEALIRPGRVDMRVKFKLADANIIKTLFYGIFATLEGDHLTSTTCVGSKVVRSETEQKTHEEQQRCQKIKEEERISQLGIEFAEIIPENTFSPAEIQGYLLKYKRSAENAVANASAWVITQKHERVKQKAKKELRQQNPSNLEVQTSATSTDMFSEECNATSTPSSERGNEW